MRRGLKFSKSSSCSAVKQLITKCLYHTTRGHYADGESWDGHWGFYSWLIFSFFGRTFTFNQRRILRKFNGLLFAWNWTGRSIGRITNKALINDRMAWFRIAKRQSCAQKNFWPRIRIITTTKALQDLTHFDPPLPLLPGDFDYHTSQVVCLAMQTDLWIGYDVHHERTRIVCTVSIPESPLHFLRLLV